ncbi:MAG: FAD-dependent oxidoreductase [Armatimonadetes bacterium]|nr:FAD-dependent oxidoreductase [Armatimonadota bacterium]
MNTVQRLPDYDVVVAGGGPAGVCAGLAAARAGMKTLVVEQFNCLGGMSTIGIHQKIAVYNGAGGSPRIVGGIAKEIADRAVRDFEAEYRPGGLFVEIEGFKYLLDRMAEEAGLDLLYYTLVTDAVVEDGAVAGLTLTNKSGTFSVAAKRFVDCTGDADVAFRAGCRMMHGRAEDGRMQPVTLMYRVGGVHWPYTERYMHDHDPKLQDFCKRAAEAGLMGPWQSQLMGFWWIPSRPDQVGINFTHMHLDGSSAFDLTRAAIEGRKQVREAVEAMRAMIPGFEKSYLIDTAAQIGVRETRRIFGEYVLTEDDLKGQTIFEDSIGLGAAFVDIHNTEGPGMDRRSGFDFPAGGYYSIPYRSLVPESVDNLLVAGRCHSVTHEAAGSTRWMTQCMVMGQAAGEAAALSIEDSAAPRGINIPTLQERLASGGAVLR